MNNTFDFLLKRPVSARYVTVSFINCDNYMAQIGQDRQGHNIDLKTVAFYGKHLRTSRL